MKINQEMKLPRLEHVWEQQSPHTVIFPHKREGLQPVHLLTVTNGSDSTVPLKENVSKMSLKCCGNQKVKDGCLQPWWLRVISMENRVWIEKPVILHRGVGRWYRWCATQPALMSTKKFCRFLWFHQAAEPVWAHLTTGKRDERKTRWTTLSFIQTLNHGHLSSRCGKILWGHTLMHL